MSLEMIKMKEILQEINIFLKKHQWCDFEIISLQGNLIIGGKTGFSDEYDIRIIFEDVFFIKCLYEWKTNTLIDSFLIPSIEEQRKINIGFSIIQGYYLCKILTEDTEPMYISAKDIKFEIIE